MAGIKNFVLGFILSLSSVVFFGRLYCPTHPKNITTSQSNVHITLFKKADTSSLLLKNTLFANIKKQSLELETPPENLSIAVSPEGIEDDEILSIALDDDIPIEFSTSFDSEAQTEVLTEDTEEKSAMLPTELHDDETFESDTPWVVAKGSPYIKNKQLLTEMEQKGSQKLFTETIASIEDEQEDLSYKVAEKIKQSIIFPIPDEILNDEDLTPTFIHTKKEPPSSKTPKVKASTTSQKTIQDTKPVKVTEEPEKPVYSSKGNSSKDTGILNSISAWFTDKTIQPDNEEKPVVKPRTVAQKKKAPSYSSQNKEEIVKQTQAEDLAKFYESLQQTRNEHIQRNIASLELKLSFQPGRAEISGKTLHWLKMFSEAALQHDAHLQVRLDGSVDTELQKKRLNLLYTIFMNNGVDFKKIDTVFTLTEPNAFIIRTLKTK